MSVFTTPDARTSPVAEIDALDIEVAMIREGLARLTR
jgi:hypothetical protein